MNAASKVAVDVVGAGSAVAFPDPDDVIDGEAADIAPESAVPLEGQAGEHDFSTRPFKLLLSGMVVKPSAGRHIVLAHTVTCSQGSECDLYSHTDMHCNGNMYTTCYSACYHAKH